MKKFIFAFLLLIFIASYSKADVTMAYFYSKDCLVCQKIEPFISYLENLSYVEVEKYKVELLPEKMNENDSLLYNLSEAYNAIRIVPIIFMANEWYFFNESNLEEEKQRLLNDLEELKNYSIESPIKNGKLNYPKPVCILIVYNSKHENVKWAVNEFEKNIKFVRVDVIDIKYKENESIAKKLGVEETPVVFIGEKSYLLNKQNISFLINEAKKYEKIGLAFPSAYEEKEICMLLFYNPKCSSCREFRRMLDILATKYPLDIKVYNINLEENYDLLLDYYEKYNITKSHSTNLFVGDKYFYSIAQKDEIEGEIKKWLHNGLDCPTPGKGNPEEFLKKYTLIAVAVGGLLDGVNPCAFATLIFFIAYLERVKRKEAILPIGISFAIAIYICYFLIGLGFLEFLNAIEGIEILSLYLYGVIGFSAVILGFFSLYDFVAIRKEKKVVLQLPNFLKKRRGRVIKRITEDKKIALLALIAFISGFLISAIEFACTGQILLPIIAVIKSSTASKTLALIYLIIYNIMFILPLLFILALFYFGYSSKAMAGAQKKSYAYVKLFIGIFLIIIGSYMVYRIM
ncbi:MAG: hypothetical protein DRN11_01060 [Thermoplasmata archaeon]|nr:MAG: hypothetical protein DRN11_01060 [Thermoplasmata archaeon]